MLRLEAPPRWYWLRCAALPGTCHNRNRADFDATPRGCTSRRGSGRAACRSLRGDYFTASEPRADRRGNQQRRRSRPRHTRHRGFEQRWSRSGDIQGICCKCGSLPARKRCALHQRRGRAAVQHCPPHCLGTRFAAAAAARFAAAVPAGSVPQRHMLHCHGPVGPRRSVRAPELRYSLRRSWRRRQQ